VCMHVHVRVWCIHIMYTNFNVLFTLLVQIESQSGDKDEEDVEQSSSATASDKMDVAELLQQLQSSKTVEMVCSIQNIINALHTIIVSSESTEVFC